MDFSEHAHTTSTVDIFCQAERRLQECTVVDLRRLCGALSMAQPDKSEGRREGNGCGTAGINGSTSKSLRTPSPLLAFRCICRDL